MVGPSGALIKRELQGTLRLPVTKYLALGYVAVLFAVIAWMWPDQAIFSVAAQSTRSIVVVLVLSLVALVVAYAPAVSATAIVSERENQSYDLLLASRLRPWQVITGKLLACLFSLAIPVIWSFPFFTACFFLGAVSIGEALRIYLVCATSGVLSALVGLWVSSRADSSYMALLRTYVLMIALCVAPWLPHILAGNRQNWVEATYHVRALSPLAAVPSLLVPGFDPGIEAATRPSWQIFLVFALVVSVLLYLLVLVRAYTAESLPIRRAGRVIDERSELIRRKLRFPFYLIDPDRRKKLLADWMNPVFARELRSRAFGGGVWIFRGAYICLAVSIVLMILMLGRFSGFTPDTVKAAAIGFQIGLILVLVPPLTAGGITRERELRMLDELRLSHIGPWRLLSGKLLVAMVFVLFLVVGSVPLWLVIAYMQMNTAQELLIVGAILGATVLLALSAGLACSAFMRRTPAAAAASYALLFMIVVATLLPWLQPERFADAVKVQLMSLNPFVSAVNVVNVDPVRPQPVLWQDHLTVSFALSAALLVLAAFRIRQLLQPEK